MSDATSQGPKFSQFHTLCRQFLMQHHSLQPTSFMTIYIMGWQYPWRWAPPSENPRSGEGWSTVEHRKVHDHTTGNGHWFQWAMKFFQFKSVSIGNTYIYPSIFFLECYGIESELSYKPYIAFILHIFCGNKMIFLWTIIFQSSF